MRLFAIACVRVYWCGIARASVCQTGTSSTQCFVYELCQSRFSLWLLSAGEAWLSFIVPRIVLPKTSMNAASCSTDVASAIALATRSITEENTSRHHLMTVLYLIREQVPAKPCSAVMKSIVEYCDLIQPIYIEGAQMKSNGYDTCLDLSMRVKPDEVSPTAFFPMTPRFDENQSVEKDSGDSGPSLSAVFGGHERGGVAETISPSTPTPGQVPRACADAPSCGLESPEQKQRIGETGATTQPICNWDSDDMRFWNDGIQKGMNTDVLFRIATNRHKARMKKAELMKARANDPISATTP